MEHHGIILSQVEVDVLTYILASIEGHPTKSFRSVSQKIYEKVVNHSVCTEEVKESFRGEIFFSECELAERLNREAPSFPQEWE